jgi:hypothetical protein
MSFKLNRSVAGFVLLGGLAAGCGTAVAAHPAAKPKPAATAHHHHSQPTHPAVSKPARITNPIPQGNGGDQDGDNNGGPSDGDGNV